MRRYEPQNLKQTSANEYCLAEHPSLKISNGKWYWFSHQTGGVSALDFLCNVRGYSFLDAVEALASGQIRASPPFKSPPPIAPPTPKTLVMPPEYRSNAQVTAYLVNRRGIAREVVDRCFALNILYEDVRHNCVFVGRDERGNARYVSLRGTVGEFKGEAQGSDKSYGFVLPAVGESSHLVVAESAVDVLSLATLSGAAYAQTHLSLGGTSAAAVRYLDAHANITAVSLCLDNDAAGITGANRLLKLLRERFANRGIEVFSIPPSNGKGYNDELLNNAPRERNSTYAGRRAGR
jgi:hypothetical protein